MSRLPRARVVSGIPRAPTLASRARTVPGIMTAPLQPFEVAPTGRTWEPKYPEFAVHDDQMALGQARTAEEAIAAEGSDPWTISPATSHTEMFRLVDASRVREITAWDAEGKPIKVLAGGSKLAILNARSGLGSTLDVRFKPQKNRPAYEYVYFFRQNHAEARSVFEAMKATEHPWEVGYQRLVLAKVPYRRISGSPDG